MAEHYNFQPGSFKPVEQADFVPEMEKDYAKVTRDEEDYFNALLRNDKNRADNIKNTVAAAERLWVVESRPENKGRK